MSGRVAAADPKRARPLDERVDEARVQIARDVDPLDADAHLAAVRERSPRRAFDGTLEVGVAEDEHRVLAAELEDHRPQELGCGSGDVPPGRRPSR